MAISLILHRGVRIEHPAYQDALQGNAFPVGGHSDPESHNLGDTQSIYTSWTTDYEVAQNFALRFNSASGVVLTQEFLVKDRVTSPDYNQEAEILVVGDVYKARVTIVSREQ